MSVVNHAVWQRLSEFGYARIRDMRAGKEQLVEFTQALENAPGPYP